MKHNLEPHGVFQVTHVQTKKVYDISLLIDRRALATLLAGAAIYNKSGKGKLGHGCIVAVNVTPHEVKQ